MAGNKLDVHVVTPEREVWRGEADMVVAQSVEGQLGILPGHAPLLIQLAIGPLFIQTEGERVAAAVDGGFLHVISAGDESRVRAYSALSRLSLALFSRQ